MNYVGIDIRKRYCVLVAIDERGQDLARGRIDGNSACGFAQFFAAVAGPSKAVLEVCLELGRIHHLLKEIDSIEKVVLAHPLKTRLIADAQIKTDALDAKALATLLRGDSFRKLPGEVLEKVLNLLIFSETTADITGLRLWEAQAPNAFGVVASLPTTRSRRFCVCRDG